MARKISFDSSEYESFIDIKRIPILPLDNRWHQLFPANQKPSHIKKLESEVMKLIKRESGVSKEMKDLLKLKKKLMDEIRLNMSEGADEKESIRKKKLEASGRLIQDINDKIEKIETEKYELPHKLVRANANLLFASINECYEQIDNNTKQIEALDIWINQVREELKKNVILKQEKEEMNQNIYTYMHDILGAKFMEVFDKGHNNS